MVVNDGYYNRINGLIMLDNSGDTLNKLTNGLLMANN